MKFFVAILLSIFVVNVIGKDGSLSTPKAEHRENLALLNNLNIQNKKVLGIPNVGNVNNPVGGNVQITYSPPFPKQSNIVPFTYNPLLTNQIPFGNNQILPYTTYYYPIVPLGPNYATNFYTVPLGNNVLPQQTAQVVLNSYPINNLVPKNPLIFPVINNDLTISSGLPTITPGLPLPNYVASPVHGTSTVVKNVEPNQLPFATSNFLNTPNRPFRPSNQIVTPTNSGIPQVNPFNNPVPNHILTSQVQNKIQLQAIPPAQQSTYQPQLPEAARPVQIRPPVPQPAQLIGHQAYTLGVQQPVQVGQQLFQFVPQPVQTVQQLVSTELQPPQLAAGANLIPRVNTNPATLTQDIKINKPAHVEKSTVNGESAKRGLDSSIVTITGNGLLPPLTTAEEKSREEFLGLLKSYVASRDGGVVGSSNINKFQNGEYHKTWLI